MLRMARVTFACFSFVLAPLAAQAGPYFRLYDPQHPHINTGAYLDPSSPGNTEAGISLALITHSPNDGRLIQSIPDDWSPLTVGGSMNHGDLFFSIGPSFNLSEPVKWFFRKAFNALADEDKYDNLRGLLAPANPAAKDATVSISPSWVILPTDGWRGQFRLFCGAAWRF